MFDWVASADRLYRITRKQVGQFLAGSDEHDLYGVGFFCDAYNGDVYLVANTGQYHQSSLSEVQARFGQTDAEVFKWDIGNWKYPAGLFPSSSTEQAEFDESWDEYREALSKMETDKAQELLEDVCRRVLLRLFSEGAFSARQSLAGFTVLGPDDREEDVLDKRRLIDRGLEQGEIQHCE